MSITNGYATLTEVKAAMRLTDTVDDSALEVTIEAASRMLEGFCGRRFYLDTAVSARVFTPLGSTICYVDDIGDLTGLVIKSDTSLDASFGTTWTTADYQLEPLNGLRNGVSWPRTKIVALKSLYFPTFGAQATVQVTAKWGWASVPHEIRQACIIQTVALAKAVDAPLGVAGFGEMGGMRLRQSLHPSAAALAAPFCVATPVA